MLEYLFKGKLLVVEYGERKTAIVSDDSLLELYDYIQENPAVRLSIGCMGYNKYDKKYEGEDLKFLKNIPNVKYVNIWMSMIGDFAGLNHLNDLLELSNLSDEDWKVDFEKFDSIENISLYWNKGIKNLFNRKNLKTLEIRKYKPTKINDLSEFINLDKLEDLTLTQSSLTSLNGLESLESLKKLCIAYNSKLTTFCMDESIVMENIKELVIESSKKVDDSFVRLFPNLECLELRNQGEIKTIRPYLDGFRKLKRIFVGAYTKIKELENQYYLDYPNIEQFFYQDTKGQHLKCSQLDKPWISR